MKIDLIATSKNKRHADGTPFVESRYIAKALVGLGHATYANKALVSSPVVKDIVAPISPTPPVPQVVTGSTTTAAVAPVVEPIAPPAPPAPPVAPKTRATRKSAAAQDEDEK